MSSRLLTRPEPLLVMTFAGLILAGTLVLRLPVCHGPETTVGLLDAFFTATSAVCVTGLITVDTETGFSQAGQVVILVLIQLGGLGVMTFGAFAVQIFQRRMSFGSQAALQDVFFQTRARGDLKSALRAIVLLTFSLEALGAVLIRIGISGSDVSAGWYEAVFLSVSAFCNAGFSVYSDNVMGFRDAALVVWTLMLLIVVGGLGYPVLLEIGSRTMRWLGRRNDGSVRWSLNSRVVLTMSVLLTFGGALAVLLSGLGHEDTSYASLGLHALFQSVTTRTAGFNTVDMALVPAPTLLIMIVLMFIGGSPGSCAGGIKTTSAAVWVSRVLARLTGREDVDIGGRRLPHDVVRRASLVFAVAALWNAAGIMVLTITENVGSQSAVTTPEIQGEQKFGFEQIVFEQFSAFSTVGLSTGVTPGLSAAGKLWIIASMFVGRLGPLTIAFAVMRGPRSKYAYPQERVMIG